MELERKHQPNWIEIFDDFPQGKINDAMSMLTRDYLAKRRVDKYNRMIVLEWDQNR